jgi:DNA-binding NarL/FixJ family response regulator
MAVFLTGKEMRILKAFMRGTDYCDIAAMMGISQKGVHSHICSILNKSGLSGRENLTEKFYRETEWILRDLRLQNGVRK